MSIEPNEIAAVPQSAEPAPQSADRGSLAEKIVPRLAEAKAALAMLELQREVITLDWGLEKPGAEERMEAFDRDIEKATAKVKGLELALTAATAKDEAEERQRWAAIIRSQIGAVRSHLNARMRAAAKFTKAAEELNAAWLEMIAEADKAKAARPVGSEWPLYQSLCEFGHTKQLCERELYRIGGDDTIGNLKSLPGGKAGDQRLVHNHRAIKPMAEELKVALDDTIAVLQGRLKRIESGEVPLPAAPVDHGRKAGDPLPDIGPNPDAPDFSWDPNSMAAKPAAAEAPRVWDPNAIKALVSPPSSVGTDADGTPRIDPNAGDPRLPTRKRKLL